MTKPLISKRWPTTMLLNPAFKWDRNTDLKARFEREKLKQQRRNDERSLDNAGWDVIRSDT